MFEALRLHTVTHLRFFARSRILLGLAVVLGGIWTLGLISFLLSASSNDRFNMLKTISEQLHWFGWLYTAGMGLFAYWWHTTQRTTTLIFTRRGRPEIWLASVFGSAFLAAAVIHALGLLVTLALSFLWGIPWQWGFVWMAADGFCESVILVSVLTGLAAVFHPIVALLVAGIFTESLFYQVDAMLLGYLQANGRSAAMVALEYVVRAIHFAVPMFDPFNQHTGTMEGTLRTTRGDWVYLAASAGYALLVFAFWFAFADYRIRRRLLS
jgi:hypothetical protein